MILDTIYLTLTIHAPARGATNMAMHLVTGYADFNPRTREGCDKASSARGGLFRKFQSTHPRGVRLALNSTYGGKMVISIHAPARGATQRTKRVHFPTVFQSTHPRGVRRDGAVVTAV